MPCTRRFPSKHKTNIFKSNFFNENGFKKDQIIYSTQQNGVRGMR